MHITINNIKGEKRLDLSYSIQNFDSDKEIAVIRMLSDNVKYEILKLYDKCDDFDFHIVNFPYLSSNIPSGSSYGVYISQLIRYA